MPMRIQKKLNGLIFFWDSLFIYLCKKRIRYKQKGNRP